MLCQSANPVLCESPCVHRLHGQIHSWKSAKNLHSRRPWIFWWSGVWCAFSTMNGRLWKENEGALQDPLLGSAVGLAQASSTTFISTDQAPFKHRNWCCPEFRISFSPLPSPPYHFKSCMDALCHQCLRPSKTSVGNFGSARVVVQCLWRHLNF